jgi:hypothetical protein
MWSIWPQGPEVPVTAPSGRVGVMTPDTSRDDAAGPLDAAEQDPSAEADLGTGPARTDPQQRPGDGQAAGESTTEDDVPKAPAGPGATPADPDQPLNPA